MIKVIVPIFIQKKGILDDNIIKDICNLSFNETDYELEYENRTNGRYIKLVKEYEVHFVCLTANEREYNGRNSFLSQYLGTVYRHYESAAERNKKMEVYLLMKTDTAFSPYQNFIYRCCKTLQINLLNIEKTILPFSTCREIKQVRSKISSRNSGNNSSYFSDMGDYIEFFGKCYGANGKESVILALVIKRLTDKRIIVYEVEDNGQRLLSATDRKVLSDNGIELGGEINSKDFNKVDLESPEKNLRNQSAFRLSLFEKYGDKKCYLCACDIDNLIIASHIHRVTDIKNDAYLTEEEKKKQIIDGDNGLWLCANHDKLFEYGLIYFDNKKMIISNRLNDEQQQFVKEITPELLIGKNELDLVSEKSDEEEPSFSIRDIDYNDNMKHYLELHKRRVEHIV